jgi:hypothetical protein
MCWLVLCRKVVLDTLLRIEELLRGTEVLMLCIKILLRGRNVLLRERNALLLGTDVLVLRVKLELNELELSVLVLGTKFEL